jgi:hypothetical protein
MIRADISIKSSLNIEFQHSHHIGRSIIMKCLYNPEEYGERVMKIALQMLEEQAVEPLNYTTHTWIPKD